MKLEIGKRYIRRDGRSTGPLETTPFDNTHAATHPFRDSNIGYTYTEAGHYSSIEGKPHYLDIVAEHPDSSVKPENDNPAEPANSDPVKDTLHDLIGCLRNTLGYREMTRLLDKLNPPAP